MQIKELIPSLTPADIQELEEKGMSSVEKIGWHDDESLSPWIMSNATTKRKLTVLMNCIAKFGYDRNKSVNEMFKALRATITPSNDSTADAQVKSRKIKPKWSVKEVTKFDGYPKNWVDWIKNTKAIIGQTGCKGIMESKIEAEKAQDVDEELYYILLTSVLDGTAHHVVAAGDHRSGYQAMTALKKWFSGNEAQHNTIDSILEDLSNLKLDECVTAHECINKFIRLIESLKTLKEKMPP